MLALALWLVCQADVSFEEKRLATLPEGVQAGGAVFSSDGRSVLYPATRGTRAFVMLGDRPLDEFDEVKWPEFMPDGKSVYYLARTGKSWQVVAGEKRGESFESVWGADVTRDGKTMFYKAKADGKEFIVSNGTRGEAFDAIDVSVVAQPAGTSFVYNARRGTEWFSVMDGAKTGPFDEIGHPIFSTNGKTLVYTAKKGDKQQLVMNGKPGELFDSVGWPAVSADGGTAAHGAQAGGKCYLVVNGEKREVTAKSIWSVGVSGDGKLVAYALQKSDDSCEIVVGEKGVAVPDIWMCESLLLRADGKEVAAELLTGGKRKIFAKGRMGEGCEWTRWLQFTPGGDIAYVGSVGRKIHLVIGEAKSEPFEEIAAFRVLPDGRMLFLAEKEKQRFLVCGTWRSERFEWAARKLHVNKEGTKVALGISKGRELWWKVVDLK